METQAIPAGTIVVGVDGSGSSDRALSWAVQEAAKLHRDVTLLNSFSLAESVWLAQAGIDYGEVLSALRDEGHQLLKLAHEEVATRAPDVRVHEVLVRRDIRDALVDLSRDAAMVVLGSRGRGPVRSLLLGSVGAAVIRRAECPVVIHRPHQQGLVRRGVLVGVDGTEHSQAALEFAFEHASRHDLPLTVLHCTWSNPLTTDTEPHILLAQATAGLQERYPDVHVTREVERGAPEARLVGLGDHMDLVVVGAHAGGLGSAILLGSVAASVVEHAKAPVAVVPPARA